MLTASTDMASLLDAKTGTDADQLHSSVRLVRSFIAILALDPCGSLSASPRLQRLRGWDSTHVISRDGASELAFVDAEPCGRTMPGPAGRVTLIVGDDVEWEESQGKVCMGNAACLEWDAVQGSISVLSSIVAMPPIFVCRTPGAVVVTSELYLLRAVAQLPLAIDPQSAVQPFEVTIDVSWGSRPAQRITLRSVETGRVTL